MENIENIEFIFDNLHEVEGDKEQFKKLFANGTYLKRSIIKGLNESMLTPYSTNIYYKNCHYSLLIMHHTIEKNKISISMTNQKLLVLKQKIKQFLEKTIIINVYEDYQSILDQYKYVNFFSDVNNDPEMIYKYVKLLQAVTSVFLEILEDNQ